MRYVLDTYVILQVFDYTNNPKQISQSNQQKQYYRKRNNV